MEDKIKSMFVPYEMAVELKELGFDEPCLATYRGGSLYNSSVGGYLFDGKWDEHKSAGDQNQWVSASIWSQVTEWLREKHNIHVYTKNLKTGWFWIIDNTDGTSFISQKNEVPMFKSYESALEEGIKAALTYIKQNNNG